MAFTNAVFPPKRVFSPPPKTLALDVAERAFVLALYGVFAWRFLYEAARTHNTILLLVLVSETLPIVLIVIRRVTQATSLSPSDWMLAFAGTAAPLLATPARLSPIVPIQFCTALVLAGIILQISAKLALARSFGLVAANRGIKHKGPYRLIRHPMYAGYFIAHVGFLLAGPSFINLFVYSAALSFQLVQILREEQFLTSAPDYRTYQRVDEVCLS